MSAIPPAGAAPGEGRSFDPGWWLGAFGLALALALGLAAGVPTPAFRTYAIAGIGLTFTACAMLWPFVAYQAMVFSVMLLVVYVVVNSRGVNAIDLLLLPVLVASIAGGARARALREDRALVTAGGLAILAATRRVMRSAYLYYGAALLSLVVLGLRGHPNWALDSSLLLLRGCQGLAFFPLGLWWFRTDRQIRGGVDALQGGLWAMLAVNLFFMITMHVSRAGTAWLVNVPEWPISGPNEAASSLLIIWALFRARITGSRPMTRNLVMAACLVLLVATQSRSGLLAWGVFTLLSVRLFRFRTVAMVVLLAGAAAIAVPAEYWQRMSRTLAITGGTFEAYSSLIRVYSWQTALKVFAAHPITGVGYLCYRFVSWQYNDLGLALGTAEQFFIETAAGTGIIGLAALGGYIAAVWRLGLVVRRATPPGSPGHEMARLHVPLLLAMIATNLTGDSFGGITTLAQMSVWCALLVRSGQRSVVPATPATV